MTTQGTMRLLDFLVDAAELPFCHIIEQTVSGASWPCGMGVEIDDQEFMAERDANTITDVIRFAHAKHHIDGHRPNRQRWDLYVAITQVTEEENLYYAWCECDQT